MKSILKLGCFALLSLQAVTGQAVTVIKTAAGNEHSLFIKSDGSLWGMGDNANGRLGAGFGLTSTNRPLQIVSSNVTTIAAGVSHSLFRQSDGSLWAMGYNGEGQLGDTTFTDHVFPEQIVGVQVTLIAAGGEHSLFAKYNPILGRGSCWAMGWNPYGQLGDGTNTTHAAPEQILTNNAGFAVSAIEAGYLHSLFLKPDGSLWAMGWNAYGQLGDGTNTESYLPVQIVSSGVTAIAAGDYHSLFTKSGGSLWAMGRNSEGELGDNSNIDRHTPEQVQFNGVTAIAAGGSHSLFLKSDGSLWAMGWNYYGQLGDGTTNDHHLPVQIVSSNVTAIAAGGGHSLFIRSDGSLWAMGLNDHGQLGDGTYTNRHTPVQIVGGTPVPVILGLSLSGTNLVLNAANGLSGGTYLTWMSTNIAKPLNQWSPIATNVLGADGNFTITVTNSVNRTVAQRFYTLQLQ